LGQIEKIKMGSYVLVGIIKNLKTIITSKGGKMTFAVLADYNGEIEVTFFPSAWERCQNLIEADKVAILQGKIDYQKDKDRYSFIAENVVSRHDIDTAVKEAEDQNQKSGLFRNTWLYMADLKSENIAKVKKGSYTVIGYLKSLRVFKDKNDNDMAFGTLQDFEGEIDLVFFSKTYAENRHLLKLDEITALKGSIDPANDRNPEKPSFKVSSIADFPQLSRSAARKEAAGEKPPEPVFEKVEKPVNKPPEEIHIRLNERAAESEENLSPLRDYLAENSGSCTIYIHVPVTGGEKVIRTITGIALSNNDEIGKIKNINFVSEVWRK